MPGFDRVNSLHLMVGGFQAVLAYGLYEAAEQTVWPATHAAAFIPLFMIMLFFPFAFYCASRARTGSVISAMAGPSMALGRALAGGEPSAKRVSRRDMVAGRHISSNSIGAEPPPENDSGNTTVSA